MILSTSGVLPGAEIFHKAMELPSHQASFPLLPVSAAPGRVSHPSLTMSLIVAWSLTAARQRMTKQHLNTTLADNQAGGLHQA